MLFNMDGPEPLGLAAEPLHGPLRAQHGGVVAANTLPAFVLRHPPFMDHADEMPDGGAGTLETRPIVLRPLAHRYCQDLAYGGLVRVAEIRLQGDARRGRHVGDRLDELAQIAFQRGVQGHDPDLRLGLFL